MVDPPGQSLLKAHEQSVKSEATASYSQIVKASAVLGGAQGLIYVASMIRGKALAVLLGPTGIGALSIYQSVIQTAQTIASLGIPTSGVREVANRAAQTDSQQLNCTIAVIRRLSLLTAIGGFLMMIGLSNQLSEALGQGSTMARDIKILGLSVFFLCLAGGESAILQGLRKMRIVATTQVASFLSGMPLLLGLCFVWGLAGITPGMAAGAAITWAITRYATRGIGIESSVSWSDTLRHSGPILLLGAALMSNAVAASAVALATRAIVIRSAGLEANGVLQAAWMLAGIFVTFLFSAMGTDFLPRLSEAKSHLSEVHRLVNEQLEVAILLSAPGILMTLALCPWLVRLFYSADFGQASVFVPWFLVGNLLQIFGWPLGFIQMLLAKPRTYILVQLAFHSSQIGLVVLFFPSLGLYAVTASFVICYGIYFIAITAYARRRIGFRFTSGSLRQIILSSILVVVAVVLYFSFSTKVAAVLITFLSVSSAMFSVASLSFLLPKNHRLQPILSCYRYFTIKHPKL
jgi:PST family polysaccharide transporter